MSTEEYQRIRSEVVRALGERHSSPPEAVLRQVTKATHASQEDVTQVIRSLVDKRSVEVTEDLELALPA